MRPVRSRSNTSPRRVLAATLVVCGAALLPAGVPTGSASAATGAASPRATGLVAAHNGARWLSARLGAGMPLKLGKTPDWVLTVDAAAAVAAVDRAFGSTPDPVRAAVWAQVVAHREEMVTVLGKDDPGRLAKVVLFAVGEGHDPRAVGSGPGVDLVARLLATMRTSGPDAGLFGDGIPSWDGAYRQGLALRALALVGVTPPAAAVSWLVGQQCADGSWQAHRADLGVACVVDLANYTGPETNSTAAALIGLTAAHAATAPTDWRRGFQWLSGIRDAQGGWGYFGGDPIDANSTALVMTALAASGDLAGWDASVGALKSLALPCGAEADGGAFQFVADGGADTMATVQAVDALALHGAAGVGEQPAADAGLGAPGQDCTTVEAVTTTTTTTTPAAAPSTPGPGSSTTVPASTTTTATATTAAQGVSAQVAGASTENTNGAAASSSGGSALAVTGTGSRLPALGGALAILVGLVLSLAARRRRVGVAPSGGDPR